MKSWHGIWTALITPFFQGKIDWDSLENILHKQVSDGVQGFVVCGTTAESPTLTPKEKEELFRFVRARVQVPILVGTGSSSTQETVEQTQLAQKWGSDGALVVVPPYNKPSQKGLLAHFQTVADKAELPIVLYNVPSRVVVSLEPATIEKLFENPRIVGIKEASGQIPLVQRLVSKFGKSKVLLSGDDESYPQFLQAGGHGIVSVGSHVFPKNFLAGNLDTCSAFLKVMYSETNPMGVKMALFLQGVIRSPELRLPLVEFAEVEKLRAAMKGLE